MSGRGSLLRRNRRSRDSNMECALRKYLVYDRDATRVEVTPNVEGRGLGILLRRFDAVQWRKGAS